MQRCHNATLSQCQINTHYYDREHYRDTTILGYFRYIKYHDNDSFSRRDIIADPGQLVEAELHLQRLDVLKLVGVPLFDLLVLPRCEEEVSLWDELEEHDAAK